MRRLTGYLSTGWVVFAVCFAVLGAPAGRAALLALVPIACWGVSALLAHRVMTQADVPGGVLIGLQTAARVGSFTSAVTIWFMLLHLRHGLLLGLATAAPAWFVVRRSTRRSVALGSRVPRLPSGLDDARRQVAAARDQLRDASMDAPERLWVELNLVSSLTVVAGLSLDARALHESLGLLERLLADARLSDTQRVFVVRESAETMGMLASLGGDVEGWAEVIEQFAALATTLPAGPDRRAVTMRAHAARAQLHAFHLNRLDPVQADGLPAPEFEARLDQTLAAYEAALEAAEPGSPTVPHLRKDWATYALFRDPDGALAALRQAYAESRHRAMTDPEDIQVALGSTLVLHAMARHQDGEAEASVLAEVREGEALIREPAESRYTFAGQTTAVLATAARFREDLGEHVPEAGRLHRLAYERTRGTLVTDASVHANAWAEWAAAKTRTDPRFEAEAAEAYGAVVREFAGEVARRTDPEEIRRHTASMQGVAAEAGYWLARAGRIDDALTAVESARAMLLSTRIQRLPDDLADRLRQTGRADLLDRLTAAEQALDRAERVQYEQVPGRAVAGWAPDRQAWIEFRAVRQEIDEVIGPETPASQPFAWDPRHGRLVYLAAARLGGYALVVDHGGPRVVRLPGLTAEEAEADVETFRRLVTGEQDDEPGWHGLLDRLGALLTPVTEGLGPGAQLIVVPLGGLGLLPLHAARTPAGYLDERVTVRYAPNARLFREATRNTQPPRTALVAGAPRVPGQAELPQAGREARWVAGRLPGARLFEPAELTEILDHLDQADLWHFACHGLADPTEPLDSAVLLTDAPLTLRHLLGRADSRHRLAVLSACQTSVPDPGRLDEVISFPGALLRAGVAGVVATQWSIDDTAAALVVRRFYDNWRSGSAPHVALTDAQRWLRGATQAEVSRALGSSVTVPDHPTGRWLRRPYADKPWAWAAFTYTGA